MRQTVPLKTGATELVAHLYNLSIPLAIATSMTTREAELHLEQAQLRQFFQAVISRDLVHASKPEPDIYLAAAARLQLQPNRCITLAGLIHRHPLGATCGMYGDHGPGHAPADTRNTRALCRCRRAFAGSQGDAPIRRITAEHIEGIKWASSSA